MAALTPQPAPTFVALVFVLYFVGVTGYDTVMLVRSPAATRGVTRRRMQAATLGSTALALAVTGRILVVDDDLNAMPEVDGYAVAAVLQARDGPRVPILLITADGQAPAKAERVHAFAYLRKPFVVEDLLRTIRSQLAGR